MEAVCMQLNSTVPRLSIFLMDLTLLRMCTSINMLKTCWLQVAHRSAYLTYRANLVRLNGFCNDIQEECDSANSVCTGASG